MRRRNEVLVGIFATAAVVIGIFGTLWLARRGLSDSYPLHAVFPWGENLKQGQPVLLAGVQVGFVDEVRLDPAGFLNVRLSLDEEQRVPAGATATVTSVGFFGDKAVALTPCTRGALPPALADTAASRVEAAAIAAPCPPLAFFEPGDTVPTGRGAPSIEQLITRVDTMSRALAVITQAFETQLVQEGGLRDLRETIGQTNRLVARLNEVAAEQSRNLTLTVGTVRRSLSALDSAALDSIVDNLQASTQNLQALTQNLQQATAGLDTITTKIGSGEGTVGLLLNDPGVYYGLRESLARLDSLLADIKANPRRYINVSVF